MGELAGAPNIEAAEQEETIRMSAVRRFAGTCAWRMAYKKGGQQSGGNIAPNTHNTTPTHSYCG